MTRSVIGPAAWFLAALMALAACSREADDGDGSAGSEISAADIAVEAVESRNLSAGGNLGVSVTNVGDEPLDLTGVTLTAPPYPASSATPRGPLAPGRTVRYAVPKEAPDCAALAEYPDGVAPDEAYVVDLTAADATVSVPIGRPEVLRRLADRDCGAENVLAVADVTFGGPVTNETTGAGATVGTTVEVDRRDGATGTIEVTAVRGTVQFGLSGLGEPPLATVGPDAATASAPVTVTALRCDAHILAEGKKNYLFGVFVSLDGGPDALVEIQAPEDLRAALVGVCDVH